MRFGRQAGSTTGRGPRPEVGKWGVRSRPWTQLRISSSRVASIPEDGYSEVALKCNSHLGLVGLCCLCSSGMPHYVAQPVAEASQGSQGPATVPRISIASWRASGRATYPLRISLHLRSIGTARGGSSLGATPEHWAFGKSPPPGEGCARVGAVPAAAGPCFPLTACAQEWRHAFCRCGYPSSLKAHGDKLLLPAIPSCLLLLLPLGLLPDRAATRRLHTQQQWPPSPPPEPPWPPPSCP